jgi:hypothetical protein
LISEWQEALSHRKGRGGRMQKVFTKGHFNSNPKSDYYGNFDKIFLALAGYDWHGK